MSHGIRALVLTAFVLAAAVLGACSRGDGDGTAGADRDGRQEQGGGTVVVALDQEPAGWNPNKPSGYALGVLTQHVLPSAFLVRPDFEVAMNEELLVDAVEKSSDPHTIEYLIRDDAAWSDGVPITADDFVYVWEQIVDPSNDVATTRGYDDIATITPSADGKQVTVVFEQPFADWRALFNHILPAHVMRTIGWDGLEGANIPTLSGGPFMLTDYRPEQSIRMIPNTKYWGRNTPVLDEVIIRFGIAPDDLAAAFENDEVDIAYPQPEPHLLEDLTELGAHVESEIGVGLTFEHLDFDMEHATLENRAVRHAIALALDEAALAEQTARSLGYEGGPLHNRIYAEGHDAYEPHGAPYRGVDVAGAERALEGEGYVRGGDGFYAKDGETLSLRLSTTGGNALREATQSMIKDQLAEAGVAVEVDNEPGNAVFGRVFPDDPSARDFDMALFSWVRSPFASANEPLYTTGSAANDMHYSNPRVDDLFEEARRQLDGRQAANTYNRIDHILWEDLPTVPLYASPSLLVRRTDIVNVEDNVSTAGPLWNMYSWALVN